eukprot:494923-Hanusia_phi.AAC.3
MHQRRDGALEVVRQYLQSRMDGEEIYEQLKQTIDSIQPTDADVYEILNALRKELRTTKDPFTLHTTSTVIMVDEKTATWGLLDRVNQAESNKLFIYNALWLLEHPEFGPLDDLKGAENEPKSPETIANSLVFPGDLQAQEWVNQNRNNQHIQSEEVLKKYKTGLYLFLVEKLYSFKAMKEWFEKLYYRVSDQGYQKRIVCKDYIKFESKREDLVHRSLQNSSYAYITKEAEVRWSSFIPHYERCRGRQQVGRVDFLPGTKETIILEQRNTQQRVLNADLNSSWLIWPILYRIPKGNRMLSWCSMAHKVVARICRWTTSEPTSSEDM